MRSDLHEGEELTIAKLIKSLDLSTIEKASADPFRLLKMLANWPQKWKNNSKDKEPTYFGPNPLKTCLKLKPHHKKRKTRVRK